MAKNPSSNTSAGMNSVDVTDDTVTKMGRALAEIAEVEQELANAMGHAATENDKQLLAEEAHRAIAEAVRVQGLTVNEFNQVVRASDNDQTLRERLTEAMRVA